LRDCHDLAETDEFEIDTSRDRFPLTFNPRATSNGWRKRKRIRPPA